VLGGVLSAGVLTALPAHADASADSSGVTSQGATSDLNSNTLLDGEQWILLEDNAYSNTLSNSLSNSLSNTLSVQGSNTL
jgi:hypothetical protein